MLCNAIKVSLFNHDTDDINSIVLTISQTLHCSASYSLLPRNNIMEFPDSVNAFNGIFTGVLILYDSLCLHCIDNFFESGNVGAYYVVALESVFLSSISHIMADVNHDSLKFLIYFFECPAQALAVL